MSFFGSLLDAVTEGTEEDSGIKGSLAREVLNRFKQNEDGGLTGLVEQLSKKGLGDIVQSWIGTGPNKDVTPEQLSHAIDNQWLKQLAAKLGISPDAVTGHLADVLPKIVDRLTPSGQLPSTIPGLDSERDHMET
jgi:uncharacterized protein YidB (DUF937 family)